MKTVDIAEATGSLSEYARQIRRGPVVLTRRGRPIAVVAAAKGLDCESLSLSTDPDFMALIERSRASYSANGGVFPRPGAPALRAEVEGWPLAGDSAVTALDEAPLTASGGPRVARRGCSSSG